MKCGNTTRSCSAVNQNQISKKKYEITCNFIKLQQKVFVETKRIVVFLNNVCDILRTRGRQETRLSFPRKQLSHLVAITASRKEETPC
jgi:hypothetical protein